MAKRHTSRQAARRRHGRAHQAAHQSRYRRKLRYEPLEHRRLLALVTVDTLDDTVDFNDGVTSLREAIFATNLVSGPDTIAFSPALTAAGPAIIVLTQGELPITDDLTINGPGAELLTIDASDSDPTPADDKGDGSSIFVIDDADESLLRDVSIGGLTLTGSDALYGGAIFSSENLTITDCTIAHNFAKEFGGGLAVFGGQAEIPNSVVRDNVTSNFGGGIAAFFAELTVANSTISGNLGRQGGGIYITDGPLDATDSHISGNKVVGLGAAGGGIHQRIGAMTITRSRIAGNEADAAGGIYSGDDATIFRSTIAGNSAERNGGGILAFERLELRESTVSNNAAGEDGGGIRAHGNVTIDGSTLAHNSADGVGGGIWLRVEGGAVLVQCSTISGNSSRDHGAGIWFVSLSGTLPIRHSTIVVNNTLGSNAAGGGVFVEQGQLSLDHTIVAENSSRSGQDLAGFLGTAIKARFCLIGNNANSGLAESPFTGPDANGNQIGGPTRGKIDPRLGPLTNNGGPTQTHPPLNTSTINTSPVIDRGDPTAVAGMAGLPEFDQRGEPFRRIDGNVPSRNRIDIGAFEAPRTFSAFAVGDFNRRRTIDAADYVLWRNTRGQFVLDAVGSGADGNGDGYIDEADFMVWRSNFALPRLSIGAAAADSLIIDEVSATTVIETVAANVDSPAIGAGMADESPVIVTTLLDVINFNDGITSLREAIFATNVVGGPDTIEFSPALTANGPATILLTQGELRITDDLAINGPGANRLTIDASGNDPTPEIDDGKGSRVFNISDGLATSIEVTLKGLSFTGGDVAGVGGAILSLESLVIESCTIVENTILPSTALTGGGGIAASLRDGAHFEMLNSVVSNNQAAGDGGGIFLSVGTNCTVQIDDSRISGNYVPLMTVVASGGGIAIRNNRGSVTITDCEILDNSTPGNGGGIAFDGNVTIERSSISGNSSLSSGGGISHGMLSSQFGALTLIDSEVANNTAVNGGGIRFGQNASTPHTIERSKILDNTATGKMPPSSAVGNGGGILTVQGSLQIVESTIDGNHAHIGGGVFASFSNTTAAEFSIENSTITNNTASQSGGGLYLSRGGIVRQSTVSKNSASDGAGIYTAFDTQVFQSTVVENSAEGEGAGLYLNNGSLLVDHSILAKNTAIVTSGDIVVAPNSIVTVRHSLIGDNGASGLTEAPVGSPDVNGNLIGGAVHGVIDPLLRPLDNNGGPTMTYALLPGSAAINAGNLNAKSGIDAVPIFDQRGEPFDRVMNGRIDIGALEFQEASDLNLLVDTLVDESDGNYERGDLSLREAIELANQWPSTDTIQFDPALTLDVPATILLLQGELRISNDLTITGPGAELLTIDASGNDPTPDIHDGKGSRVFNIDNGMPNLIKVSLSGLTFTGGDVSGSGGAVLSQESLAIQNSTITGNFTFLEGGGILANVRNGASIELTGLRVFENSARNGDGGGVLIHVRPGGTATVSSSLIYENNCGDEGGGIAVVNYGGSSSINDSRIYDNQGGNEGGGIAFGGDLTIQRCSISGNSSRERGGGIMNGVAGGLAHGALRLIDSEVSNNSSRSGGGVMLFEGPGPMHEIVRSTISGNTASYAGGGVSAQAGSLVIVDSAITGNAAAVHGGGIYSIVAAALFSIQRCTISNNSAANGAGVWMQGGMILQSTISNNWAVAGGGINTADDTLINHTTVYTNTASGVGGGVFVREGSVVLNHSIVAQNTRSLVDQDITGLLGTSISPYLSIIGTNTGTLLVPSQVGSPDSNGNLIGGAARDEIDPRLGPLVHNGGLTMTHAPLPDSPAINMGDPTAVPGVGGVPLYDQRGEPFTRVFGGRIDIGAIEAQPNPLTGDYNFDGVVDAGDYALWRNTRNSKIDLRADGNGDGVVDQSDHDVWRANFGRAYAAGSSPEIDSRDWTDRVDEVFQLLGSGAILPD